MGTGMNGIAECAGAVLRSFPPMAVGSQDDLGWRQLPITMIRPCRHCCTSTVMLNAVKHLNADSRDAMLPGLRESLF